MKPFYFVMLCVISFFVLVFYNGFFCFAAADTNAEIIRVCDEYESTVNEDTFQTNKKTLLDSLASNVVDHHGFYQTIVGKKSNRVYGTILCRGDISANNCSVCALNSTRVASNHCSKSRDVTVWFRWCFVHYSNKGFSGEMKQITMSTATANDTNIDDPSLVSLGIPFMSGVAAATSVNSFMFQTEVLNFNQSEKRYGMAQCTRDISRKGCRRCLDLQLHNFRTAIENKRRWEIFGSNCFMWYNDYQFYFNNGSTLLLSGESFKFWLFISYNCISYQSENSLGNMLILDLNISKKARVSDP
jgi:hypothetical protein